MRVIKIILSLTVCLVIIAGCATVPTVYIQRPWMRALKLNQPITATGQLKIEVSGSTIPLVGSEQLTADKIGKILSHLFMRRGYLITNADPEYIVRLIYKTKRKDALRFSSVYSQFNNIAAGSGVGATSALGVSVAQDVSALAYNSTTISQQNVKQLPSYTHTFSLEIHNKSGRLVWKGESIWDSEELNILVNPFVPAMQLLLSHLPSDQAIRPEIPELRIGHVFNYYRLECKKKWFACPALPYPITFKSGIALSKSEKVLNDDELERTRIQNPYALAAYVDLIQTAESALPDGDEKKWKNPINISLWKKATLGGQYLLGPSRKPLNILVKLRGKTEGYRIEECNVVSDKEFEEFSVQLSKWKRALQEYYDVYVK